MAQRFWPLKRGHIITSGFGKRWGTTHWGTDFGWPGGSAGLPVFAAQGGTVEMVGAASGFGQWVVLDHPTEDGAGTTVYGHIIPEVRLGQRVEAGQRIARINPDSNTNGGVPPHLHFEVHRYVWSQPGPDRLDPQPWLAGAGFPDEKPKPGGAVQSPITRTQLSPNRHSGGRAVDWIGIHTQQAKGSAAALVNYCCDPAPEVSYNAVVDDKESVLVVPWDQNPWSASNANSRADHICMAGTFAEWDRGKWLSADTSDGVNEDVMLTRTAALVAWRCTVRGIPIEYVGGGSKPPTRRGICGHVDFGQWGGGHTDPGPNFPWDELIRRARAFATPTQEGFLMALTDEQQQQIYRELTQKYPSRSKYRANDEPVDTLAGMVLNVDARVHEESTERDALQGVRSAIELVEREAAKGDAGAKAVLDQIKKGGK